MIDKPNLAFFVCVIVMPLALVLVVWLAMRFSP
jgi:hypothetical protein